MPVQQIPDTIFTVVCGDSKEYGVRSFHWTLDRADLYKDKFFEAKILSDDITRDLLGFLSYAAQPNMLWFEIYETETDASVGFISLSDMLRSFAEDRIISATWHAVVWDAKAAPRRDIATRFIKWAFDTFRLHRLNAMIPLNRGGVARFAKRIGFQEEGILRQARRYNGEWYGVLMLSILETEVPNG